jgi:hypothetical protein
MHVRDMYWWFRYHRTPYNAELVRSLSPKPVLHDVVREIMKTHADMNTVSIHRRWIEGKYG